MRLQLSVALVSALLALLVSSRARAQPKVEVDGRTSLYADDDHTTVSSTTATARVRPIERLTLKGRYLADIVSSASVDVVAAATGRWSETRHEIEGGAAYADGTHTVSASYIYSTENDWWSHTFDAGASTDFLDHNLTLGVGGSVGLNDVGRSGDDNFHRDLTQISGSFDATLTASPRDLVGATYSLAFSHGYQSSPYRFVTFEPKGAPIPIGAPETEPDLRVRHAIGLRWNHHAFTDSALRSFLRAYGDSWGIRSVTLAMEYVIGLGDFELGLLARGYAQNGAAFYTSRYVEKRRYMTADRELSPFVDAFGGARFAWRRDMHGLLEQLRAEVKAQGFAFRFFDSPLLETRAGLLAELALGASL